MPRIEIVKLSCKRLNAASGPELNALMVAAWNSGATSVALDLSEVVYIDSLGVSVLIAQHRRRPEGSQIFLCAVNDYVREVLEITQLVRVFDIYADGAAVLAAAS